MSANVYHPPQSARFRRDLPTRERCGGAWLRNSGSYARHGFTIPAHLAELIAAGKPAR